MKATRIVGWVLAIALMLFGALVALFEEPAAGVIIAVIGILCLLNFRLSKRLVVAKLIACPVLAFVVVMIAYSGREPIYIEETAPDNAAIVALSAHPMKQAMVGSLNYYFIDEGNAEAEVIFFLHGFPDMANTWDETISVMSKQYRCIAPFLRGYYPTDMAGNEDYSVRAIAGDILTLADQLGIQKFYVVGQDWGASVTYAMATLAPDRIEKIVTLAIPHPSCIEISPQLLIAGRHFIVFGDKQWATYYTGLDDFDYIDRLYRRWSPDFKNYKESSNNIKKTFIMRGRLPAALGYYWSAFADTSATSRALYAQTPKMPVLYLSGENEGVTRGFVTPMELKMPQGSKCIVVKNAGHFLHREALDEFTRELSAFIER